MAEDSGIYTVEQLNELDDKISYMIFGQGFVACIVDPKPTRRRTVSNMLRKIGVENIAEAEDYEKTLTAIKSYPDNKLLIITDLEVGKVNGLRIITSLMSSHNGTVGIILTDTVNPKLEQIAKVTKAIVVRTRPFDEADLKEIITVRFGFRLVI